MRPRIAPLLMIGLLTLPVAAAAQARGAAPGTAGKGACSLLPRQLVEKVLGDSVNKVLLGFPPREEGIGVSGSMCSYAGITVQIDAITPQQLEDMRKTTGKDWVPVSGIGDRCVRPQQRESVC